MQHFTKVAGNRSPEPQPERNAQRQSLRALPGDQFLCLRQQRFEIFVEPVGPTRLRFTHARTTRLRRLQLSFVHHARLGTEDRQLTYMPGDDYE